MAKGQIRTRKLQPEHRPRRSDGSLPVVPCLHLSGVWLEKCGFQIGDVVEIVEREGLIVIQPHRATSEEMQAQAARLRSELHKVKCILAQVA